jgi:peroxiredoxin Q/BCP
MDRHLQAGDRAPDFTLNSTHGEQSLEAHRGKWLVLYFYPKDHTPGCTTEACDFRDGLPGMDATVLGVSADDLDSHEKFAADYHLSFPLLSDPGNELAKAYGAYGEKNISGKAYKGTLRSTFIISPQGQIATAMYDVKAAGHAGRVAEKLRELQAGNG